jgi:hypothetical protein
MKGLRITLFVLAFLGLSTQLARHVYVRWFEGRASVLDRYESGRVEIQGAKSLDELEKKYAEQKEKERQRQEARRRERAEAKAAGLPDPERRYEAGDEEFLDSMKIEQAIREWEGHENEIRELWFFCGFGMLSLVVAWLCSARGWKWVALALQVAGFSELMYWTSPSFSLSGAAHEFDRLLDRKILFTIGALAVLLVYWLRGPLRNRAEDVA